MAKHHKHARNTKTEPGKVQQHSPDAPINSGIDGDVDFPADEPLVEIRDGLAHVFHDDPSEPSKDLISDVQFAIAAKWSASVLDVTVVVTHSLRRKCYDLFYVNTRRWPALAHMELKSSHDALSVAVTLMWYAGERILVDAIEQSPWLMALPPQDVAAHSIGGISLPYITCATAMLDHWLSPIAESGGGAAGTIERRQKLIYQIHGSVLCEERVPLHMLYEQGSGSPEQVAEDENQVYWTCIYRQDEVEAAIKSAADQGHESSRHVKKLKGMLEVGCKRGLVPAPDVAEILAMKLSHPNFHEVIDYIAQQIALCHLRDVPAVHFDPVLLLGGPGIGKTHFAKSLANVLKTSFELVAMSSLSAGWIISGTSSVWGNSRSGKAFDTLFDSRYANPLIVLDELEKAGGDSRYDPLGALYGLLERDTARAFKDEYVEVSIDASHILWVATANQPSLPDPILNRFRQFTIKAAEGAALERIVQNAYAVLIKDFGGHFNSILDHAVLDTLCAAACSTRDVCAHLRSALGRAALAGRHRIETKDLVINTSTRRPIGFCA